jgi:hypothetical protein
MKTIISIQDLAELEIKPDDELQKYYTLTEHEIRSRWGDGGTLVTVSCPGCGGNRSAGVFDKWGFVYRDCARCGTLYVTARPTDQELTSYYRDSAAAGYWREKLAARTAEARREKVIVPRVQWVLDTLAEHAAESRRLIDISSHCESFLQVLTEMSDRPERIIAANPAADVEAQGLGDTRVEISPTSFEALAGLGPADAVTALDVLDRCSNIPAMLGALRETVRPGGLLFVTAPTSSGFEVQILRELSPTIVPPDKLNVFSIEGLMEIFSTGWDVIEVSTPGMLDLEIVRRRLKGSDSVNVPPFVRYLLERRGSDAAESFTEFLQTNRMTSVVRLVARRRES